MLVSAVNMFLTQCSSRLSCLLCEVTSCKIPHSSLIRDDIMVYGKPSAQSSPERYPCVSSTFRYKSSADAENFQCRDASITPVCITSTITWTCREVQTVRTGIRSKRSPKMCHKEGLTSNGMQRVQHVSIRDLELWRRHMSCAQLERQAMLRRRRVWAELRWQGTARVNRKLSWQLQGSFLVAATPVRQHLCCTGHPWQHRRTRYPRHAVSLLAQCTFTSQTRICLFATALGYARGLLLQQELPCKTCLGAKKR